MSRSSDVTIFGATGFTGQRVAAEALRSLPPELRITIAGRSSSKLQALAQQLGAADRLQVLGGVDVTKPESLQAMAQATRLLLCCVGPFRLYGEPVLAAAAAARTDYLDICGEPEFIERMELRYSAAAAASGALMASAAGFDSVPADMGCLFAQRAFAPPAVPSSVEAVISLSAPKGTSIHYATWESAVHGIGSVAELRKLRAEARRAGGAPPPPRPLGPRPAAPAGPAWEHRLARYTLPFPGADAAIVRRTQAAIAAAGEPAVHFSARFSLPSAWAAALFVAYGGLMVALARFSWGRALLLRAPGLFSRGLVSHAGPSQAQMDTTRTTLDLFAAGYSSPPPPGTAPGKPDKHVHCRVSLGDPGYLFTSVMLVQCAATLLQERQALLDSVGGRGGVFTVGTLFRGSSLLQRLDEHGVKFSVVGSS
ncbi:hypothetical protein OEZ86_008256 [Tetradesmus obliquus]|nr:hypothetical protein OEZ86_008256 [Tetradesmus obliquus]